MRYPNTPKFVQCCFMLCGGTHRKGAVASLSWTCRWSCLSWTSSCWQASLLLLSCWQALLCHCLRLRMKQGQHGKWNFMTSHFSPFSWGKTFAAPMDGHWACQLFCCNPGCLNFLRFHQGIRRSEGTLHGILLHSKLCSVCVGSNFAREQQKPGLYIGKLTPDVPSVSSPERTPSMACQWHRTLTAE